MEFSISTSQPLKLLIILHGWRRHFGQLAKSTDNPLFDKDYDLLVKRELNEIIDICEYERDNFLPVTEEEIQQALKSLNKGKSVDIYGVTSEHLLNAKEQLTRTGVECLDELYI